MDIKYKLYPYPILWELSDDYTNCAFQTAIDMVKVGYDLRLDCIAELTSVTIKQLIAEGKASYVYHIECAQTGFRHVIVTQDVEARLTLKKQDVRGKLQVCPFVVARQDLIGFSSAELHPDYNGLTFDIEAGCVIAIGKQCNFDISKERDDLANLPSIFTITKNADPSVQEMLVDSGYNKIIIKLPFDDFSTYKHLNSDPNNRNLLNALTIIPALTAVLADIKTRDTEERSELDDYSWYRTIKKVMLKTFEIDIEDAEFDDQFDPLEYAQKLINSPIPAAFRQLLSNDDESEGDAE